MLCITVGRIVDELCVENCGWLAHSFTARGVFTQGVFIPTLFINNRLSFTFTLLFFIVSYCSYCSHAQVFGAALVHEFGVTYRGSGCKLLLRRRKVSLFLPGPRLKNNTI